MNNKTIQMLDFKVKSEKERTFTCYGNVKGNIDYANDRTLDGAYEKSIETHRKNNTKPKMFWSHDSFSMPVGGWPYMEEDSTGLLLEGQTSATQKGQDLFTLLQENNVNMFSIGYIPVQEKRNVKDGCNDLIELDIKEISPCNFACNELSTLQSIQKSLGNGEMLSKADLRHLLNFSQVGLSKRQIENITAHYSCESNEEKQNRELMELVAKSSMFN